MITNTIVDADAARLQRLLGMFRGHNAEMITFLNRMFAHHGLSSPVGRAAHRVVNSTTLMALRDEMADRGIPRLETDPPEVTPAALAMRAHAVTFEERVQLRHRKKMPPSAAQLAAMLAYVAERLALLDEVQRHVTKHFTTGRRRQLRAWTRISTLLAQAPAALREGA